MLTFGRENCQNIKLKSLIGMVKSSFKPRRCDRPESAEATDFASGSYCSLASVECLSDILTYEAVRDWGVYQ
jgi:hypothetical protein